MAEQVTEPAAADNPALCPWVVEGAVDFPVQLPKNTSGASTDAMFLFLGGADFDGFVELRPLDPERSRNPVFWVQSKPLEYRLRAGVRAPNMQGALIRGAVLMEHVADRLAFLAGQFVRPLSLGAVYDEDQMRECIAGRLQEFDTTTGGEEMFRTQPIMNGVFAQQIVSPPAQALTALRWFRRGMAFQEKVDRFVAFYIALESIAEHLPGIEAERLACRNCGHQYSESKTNAGIAFLIARHPNFPAGARQLLAMLRARIVHGNADDVIRHNAADNAEAVQRLAADGIATVLGIDPAQIHFSRNPLGGLGGLQPSIMPICKGRYEKENNPLTAWNNRFLSDVFHEVIKNMTSAMQRQDKSPSGPTP